VKSATARKLLITAAAIAGVVLVLRAMLPWAVTRYVNDRLGQMGDYRGHVADVDLSVLRGAYVLRDVRIIKKRGEEPGAADQPFLVLPQADLSVQWSNVLDGELVGEIHMRQPVMNMIQGETPEETQVGSGVNWPDQVRKLFPFRFNRIEVMGGTLTFRAPGIEARESLTLRDLNIALTNLTNVENLEEPAFATFDANGLLGEATPLAIIGHVNPNAEQPTFDVDMSLEGARLVDVNPWLEEFLNVDAQKGVFSMYAELAAADGRFEGYIKPILEDAEIFELDEPSDGPLQKAWEALVGLVTAVLTNPEEDQVATQVPFSGELDDPDAETVSAIVNLLRNAFVAAFTHALEGTVTLEDVDSRGKE
jgi:hypothetical protein